MYKYARQDIEEGVKIILTDHNWYRRFYREIDDNYHLRFTRKQTLIEQPLEGAVIYIGRGQIVCSNQIPKVRDCFLHNHHPYYRTKFNDWQKPTRQEAKRLDHKYFHR